MRFDVVIIGGALVGASLAAALRNSRYRLALVEGRAPSFPPADAWDARLYAVSPASMRFLDATGVWRHLDPARITPVHDMEIHGDGGSRLGFSAYDAGVGELAWIVEGGLMQRELWETVKRQSNLTLLCPARPQALQADGAAARVVVDSGETIEAALVVGADGVESWVRAQAGIGARIEPYGELGVVANFECEKPHRNTAFQWFRPDGVLAYLPLPGNRISIVWSTAEAHARQLLALDAAELCARVARAANHRLGELSLLTPAQGFPLRLMRVERTVAQRLALIGDAAHAIHPLSGHGVNLGFQDARTLADVLTRLPDYCDCGDLSYLRPYARARAEEVLALQAVTHGLNRLFLPRNALLSQLRNFGLNLTDRLPVLRNMLVRYALG